MNEMLAQLIRVAYDNPSLRCVLLPIIISEIDSNLLFKTAKRKKKKRKPNISRQERERRRKEKQEKMLSDFEFMAHIKRTQKDTYWKDPNTQLDNNINSVISKARGGADISGENISQEWAIGIISDLYEEHKDNVDVETAYGGDQYKAELDQLHEMLDELANTGGLDELRKQSRNACSVISRKMSEGAFVERVGAISKAADNFLWGLERQAIPIVELLARLKDLNKQSDSAQVMDDELLEQASKVLGTGAYTAANFVFEEQVENLQEELSKMLGCQILDGIKQYGKEALSEGVLKILETSVGFMSEGVVGAVASAFGLEHKLRKVKGNVVELVGRGVDSVRGTQGSGEHWEEKFLQATMTPASINDEYQGRVDDISSKVKKAGSKEEILSLIDEVKGATDQYYTEARVDIDRSVQRSVVYKRMDSARGRGSGSGGGSSLDRAVAGVSNIVNLVSRAEAKGQDLVRSKLASEKNHAGISLLLIQRELEQAYAEQEIISAFESEIPKMFERTIDILKDREKRDIFFSAYGDKVEASMENDEE